MTYIINIIYIKHYTQKQYISKKYEEQEKSAMT